MQIVFEPLADRRYRAFATRRDGVTLRIKGGGYERLEPALPHDLAHFVVEHDLGLLHGFWGVIAAGGLFPQTVVVAGRQRPHAADTARRIVRDAGDRLTQAEALVRFLSLVAASGGDAAARERALRELPARFRPEALTADRMDGICAALREAAARFAEHAAAGAPLRVEWRLDGPGGVRPPAPPASARRRAARTTRSRAGASRR